MDTSRAQFYYDQAKKNHWYEEQYMGEIEIPDNLGYRFSTSIEFA